MFSGSSWPNPACKIFTCMASSDHFLFHFITLIPVLVCHPNSSLQYLKNCSNWQFHQTLQARGVIRMLHGGHDTEAQEYTAFTDQVCGEGELWQTLWGVNLKIKYICRSLSLLQKRSEQSTTKSSVSDWGWCIISLLLLTSCAITCYSCNL